MLREPCGHSLAINSAAGCMRERKGPPVAFTRQLAFEVVRNGGLSPESSNPTSDSRPGVMSSSATVLRPVDDLIGFSGQLLHSFQIYFSVGRTLARVRFGFVAPLPAWDITTALVESFAMHNRALFDFFYGPHPQRADDARAFDYFGSEEEWANLVGAPGHWLTQVREPTTRRDQFGKQIAHLTYRAGPASDSADSWPVMQLASEMGSATWRFIRSVDQRLVVAGFCEDAAREVPARARLEDARLPLLLWTPPAIRPGPA